ncbi:MAG: cytosine permease [Micrococcales bacterium]|nr:cytosine permease [Micrococcales bacterium]
MTDVPAGAGRPDDESDSIDDDALADAILATYTSSIPVIRSEPVAGPSREVEHTGGESAGQEPAGQEPAVDRPAVDRPTVDGPAMDRPTMDGPTMDGPPAEGAVGSREDERLLAETASWTSFDPSAFAPDPSPAADLRPGPGAEQVPERTAVRDPGPTADPGPSADPGRVWDLDGGPDPDPPIPQAGGDEDAGPRASTVWDLGDAGPGPDGSPDGFGVFDLPAPDDAIPVDLLSDSSPKPWDELPAPSPASKEDDGETWVSTEDSVTPFDPQPFPVEPAGPWTRLVEPAGADTEPVRDSADAARWRPPVEWAPPATDAADLFPAPAAAMPHLVPQPDAVPPPADGLVGPAEPGAAAGSPEEEPEPDAPGSREPEPAATEPEPAAAEPAAAVTREDVPAAVGGDREGWVELPPAPPVGGIGGTATPWFDLASAPPPVAPPPVAAPPTPALEPEAPHGRGAAASGPGDDPELGRGAGDSAYSDEEDGSVDPSDRVTPLSAGLPLGTVQTSALPPAQAAAVDAEAPQVTPIAATRLPRVLEVETAGADPTRLDQRAGRATRLFWLWFAANAAPLSLGIGAVLFGMGMSLRQAILAVLGGVALSLLPLGLGTLAGKWSGQPTLVVSRASFGLIGNVLPGAVAVLSRAVWGGALLWVVGDVVRIGTGGSSVLWPVLGVLGGALLTGLVAVVGYGLLSRVQFALTVLTAVLAVTVIVLTAGRVDLAAALGAGDGSWLLVASGVVLVFSFVGLAWVHSSADVARYQSTTGAGSTSMLAACLGAGLPALVLIGWGAVLAASSPALARGLVVSPLETLEGILPGWFPVPLLAGAVLASLAGALIATYSGGFAVLGTLVPREGGSSLPRPVATAIAGVLTAGAGVLLVLTGADAQDIIREVLTTVAVPVAAWAGIFAAEVMIRNRRFHTPSLLRRGGIYPDVRVPNLVAFVLITALAFGFTSARADWLSWQGWALWLLGIPRADPLAGTDIGVFLALALGLLVPLLSAIPVIRRQEAIRI